MLDIAIDSVFHIIWEKLMKYAQEDSIRSLNYNTTLRTLERNLASLCAKATDVEAEIKYGELSGQKKRKREVEKWVEKVEKLRIDIRALRGEIQSEGFVSRFLGGNRATELKERVDELAEQSKNFGKLVLDAPKTKGEILLTPRLVGKAFEENLERIWQLLTADNMTSIGIYGMGGVGKTTLAKHINNRLVEKKTQECVFWVTVSQGCSIRKLQDKIAHDLGIFFSHKCDDDKLAVSLYRALSLRNKFVLILDDVWKHLSLEKAGIPLCMEGSKLIMTTRSLQVCRQFGCQQVFPVKTFDTNEAWNLFSDTLGQEVTLTPQVEEIAKCMANVCDGLPLGIITLAGSMRGQTAIHVWRNSLEELQKSVMDCDGMEDHVFKVLKYSFDRLNPKQEEQEERNGDYTALQHCFLYCSLYPEDHMILKQDLVRKFISEELVDKRKSRGAQVDQGHTILDKLVNVCLLESVKDDRGCDCLKMHGLVRSVALKIIRGKNMVFAGCLLEKIPNEDKYWTKDAEKISLMWNSIKEIPDGISPNCPNLSTLLLQGNEVLKFIADSFFSQLHGLCVLDLSDSRIVKLPNSLSDLESLKALILGGCRSLVNVPYLGKLKALKELDLSDTRIRQVPQGMGKLVNLKFLSMDEAIFLEILPTGLILNFPYLQCLHLPDHIEAPIIEIESLRKLEEFKGRVNAAANFNRLIACKPLIKYDVIVWFPGRPGTVFGFGEYNGILVFGCNYNLMEDATMLAHDAQHLGLRNCKGLSKSLFDDFPKYNNPKSLKTLKIDNCEEVECILVKNGELQSHIAPVLGTLQKILLCGLPDFMGIISNPEVVLPTPAEAVFSSLRELVIEYCHKMKNLGLTGSEFPNLETIRVACCQEIEEIIEEGGAVSFPKLKSLELHCVPKLKHVGTRICDSIEIILIIGCRALKKLPLCFPVIDGGESPNFSYSHPPALKDIYVHPGEQEWWKSLEWEHPSHEHLLQPFLRT